MQTSNSSTRLTTRIGDTFRAAIIAGLVAGLLVSIFHLLFTERLIDLAISYEELLASQQGHEAMEEVVSRDIQKGVGLITGFMAYGLFLSFIYAVAFTLSQRLLPTSSAKSKGLILAVIAYWHLALFPFLKYPANPPAVGDPDNIAQRQALFLAAMALAFLGTLLAYGFNRLLHRNISTDKSSIFDLSVRTRTALTLGFYAIYTLGIYLALPSKEPTISIPFEVVFNFRLLSLLGLTIFWAVIGGIFSLIAARWKESLSPRPAPVLSGVEGGEG